MTKTNVLKCRWCNYAVLAWRTTTRGQRRSGWSTLFEHVLDHHKEIPEAARFIERMDQLGQADLDTWLAVTGRL